AVAELVDLVAGAHSRVVRVGRAIGDARRAGVLPRVVATEVDAARSAETGCRAVCRGCTTDRRICAALAAVAGAGCAVRATDRCRQRLGAVGELQAEVQRSGARRDRE